MDNGTTAAVIGQFDRLSALEDNWDHNRQYQREVLSRAARRGRALDLGCGTGELTRSLALRSRSVIGVDASGGMIAEAKRRNWGLNIEYAEADAEAFLRGRRAEFDFIASVAAFHHMDEGRMLRLCREALAPGGVLVVLDLFKESSPADYVVSAAATVLNPLFYLANTGRLGTSAEEREAWAAHRPSDHYKTLGELRAIASDALGEAPKARSPSEAFGGFELERKLFWRYLLVYEKP